MSGRSFFVPMIGLVLLFAALGPAIGGVLFIPLSVVFRTPTDLEAIGLVVLLSTMFGHAFGLIPAYIVGVGPAATTEEIHDAMLSTRAVVSGVVCGQAGPSLSTETNWGAAGAATGCGSKNANSLGPPD